MFFEICFAVAAAGCAILAAELLGHVIPRRVWAWIEKIEGGLK